ncbi:MAG: hypothetical protein WCF54_07100 [Terracidiphilus sp.]|jgi:hypothetical protein
MPDESKQITRVEMRPEEIICAVKMRFRICNYLFKTAFIWFGVGVIFGPIFNYHSDSEIAMMIGTAIFTLAFALTLAIYRCPVCDTYLSRFRPNKLHCPNCNAKVK